MTSEADWYEPDGVPAPPRLLAPALAILAQFDGEEALLDLEDIARLTGCSRSISKRCLVMLSDLGYLIEAAEEAYRLACGEPTRWMPDTTGMARWTQRHEPPPA